MDAQFEIGARKKHARPMIGVSGFVDKSGRKGEKLLARLAGDLEGQADFSASGIGWPVQIVNKKLDGLVKFYNGLDLYVCTVLIEGVPMPPLEALNFDAVDVTGYFFPGYPDAPKDDYIYRLKRHAFDLGLAISGTGVRNDFVTADKAVRAEGVARIKTWIEVAAKLGAPVIRAFADSQPPFKDWQQASDNAKREDVEGWLADSLRECAEHGKKFGVIVVVQNHGDFINTGEQHISLLKRVDHEYCAAMVDTGKYNTPDPYVDIAMVAPYAVTWQIKELIGTPGDSPPC